MLLMILMLLILLMLLMLCSENLQDFLLSSVEEFLPFNESPQVYEY